MRVKRLKMKSIIKELIGWRNSPLLRSSFFGPSTLALKGFHPCAHFEVNFNYIALDLEIGTLVCFLFACLCY